MVAAGARALSRYTGTLLAVFVVQMILVARGCMLAIAARARAGVRALAAVRRRGRRRSRRADHVRARARARAIVASGGIVFGVVLLWQLATWFLVGGIYGVLAQQPEGRAATARCFGASGAIDVPDVRAARAVRAAGLGARVVRAVDRTRHGVARTSSTR